MVLTRYFFLVIYRLKPKRWRIPNKLIFSHYLKIKFESSSFFYKISIYWWIKNQFVMLFEKIFAYKIKIWLFYCAVTMSPRGFLNTIVVSFGFWSNSLYLIPFSSCISQTHSKNSPMKSSSFSYFRSSNLWVMR